jgi:hypothetical protein
MRHIKTVLFLLTLSLISTAHGAVSQPADTPLPQQIAGLQKLTAAQQAHIKTLKDTLRLQMQYDAAAQTQVQSSTRQQSLAQGAGISAGAMLLIFGVILLATKQNQAKSTLKPQARAASA